VGSRSERVRLLELEVHDLKFVVNRMTRMLIDLEQNFDDFSQFINLYQHKSHHENKDSLRLPWENAQAAEDLSFLAKQESSL
jgi:hypothetical protein